MSRRTLVAIGAGILATGLVILVVLSMTTAGSVREHIRSTYRRTTVDDPALKGALVYSSSDAPSKVVSDISKRWTPAERHTDAAGQFLRYRNDIVVVAPAGGGSRIYVDETDRGYNRWYPYIGGYWGTYSGPGGGFRGGGPGSGK